MDYATRVAWMLEEEDDPLLELGGRKHNPTDARFSVSFMSVTPELTPALVSSTPLQLPLSATSASQQPSPSTSARSSAPSPRAHPSGPSGGGLLVSTGSMVSRYEKVMRASFRPPADNRTASKRKEQPMQQQQQQRQASWAQPTSNTSYSPTALQATNTAQSAALSNPRTSGHAPKPASPNSKSSQPTGSHSSPLSRTLNGSRAEEEKQQVTFTATSSPHPPPPQPTPVTASQPHSKPQPQQPHPQPRHGTSSPTSAAAAQQPAPSFSLAINPKQAVERHKGRPPTPASNRQLREQERQKQEQSEREAAWTERFIQEMAERREQRLTQTQPKQQQQTQQQQTEQQANVPVTEARPNSKATTGPTTTQEHGAAQSETYQAVTAGTAAGRQSILRTLDGEAATKTEPSNNHGQDGTARNARVSAEEQQATLRAAFKEWTITRLTEVSRQAEQSTAQQQLVTSAAKAEIAQPSADVEAISTPAQPRVLEQTDAPSASRHTEADERAPLTLSTTTCLEQEKHHEAPNISAAGSSSSSSDSSGSTPPIQLRSCLSGDGRRRSSDANVSRRVRWVDWDVE